MRPERARTSSAASGLRFCGMIEEPVVNLSDSRSRPTSGDDHITISSAKRDRCTAVIAPAASVSSTKSRSATASSEFAIGRLKPSAFAVIARSIGNEVPASAAAPSGLSLRRRARIGEAAAVARRHLDIGEQMVAEGHRLRGLQMGEARHHRRRMLERLFAPARADKPQARHRCRRSRRAPTAGNRSRPGRCASARYAAVRPPARSARRAGSRHSCECPRARA